MGQDTRPPPVLPDTVAAPAQFYTTEVSYMVLHRSNCHTLAHVYLPLSVGKLRLRGGVTRGRGEQVLRLHVSARNCFGLVPAPEAQQGVFL